MKPNTDKELILAIQRGEISAYEELVTRYQQVLYRFVMRIVHDESASREVVQDALVKVYQLIDTIDPQKKFSTFLFEIAKNASFSILRKNKRIISLDAISDIEDDKSFLEEYLRKDQIDAVRSTVYKLERKYSMVLSMYYFDDLSYEEIAKKLNIPMNTVRTHIRRAKEEFKKKYTI